MGDILILSVQWQSSPFQCESRRRMEWKISLNTVQMFQRCVIFGKRALRALESRGTLCEDYFSCTFDAPICSLVTSCNTCAGVDGNRGFQTLSNDLRVSLSLLSLTPCIAAQSFFFWEFMSPPYVYRMNDVMIIPSIFKYGVFHTV